MIWQAFAVMACATLACQMGLPEAVARILLKMAKCPKCCSFWAVLAALAFTGRDIVAAVLLSVLAAYASHWFGILPYMANGKYEDVWRRLQRRKRRVRRPLR